MKRFAPFALALLLAGCLAQPKAAPPLPTPTKHPIVSAAIGGQGGKPALGARTADIRDFGATTTADCSVAVQRAYDSLVGGQANAATNNAHGVLFIPSGVWSMNTPLWADASFVDVIGEHGSTLACPTLGYPIISGEKRNADWNSADPHFGDPGTFNPDHRVSTSGKLDSTLGPGHYGYTSRSPSSNSIAGHPNVADHAIKISNSPPANGQCDYWRDTRVGTIEFCVENPRGAMNVGQPNSILGMGAVGQGMGISGSSGGPFTVSCDATQFIVSMNTLEGPLNTPRSWRFGNSTLSGVQKLWISWDFSQNDTSGFCLLRAGQNGQQVAVTRGTGTNQAATTIDITTNSTGGSFTLTGKRLDTGAINTSTINNGDNHAALVTDLNAVYGSSNFTVTDYGSTTGTGVGSAFRITFVGTLAGFNQAFPILDGTNLTGTTGGGLSGGMSSGFAAANILHFSPNYLCTFWFFGDYFAGTDMYCAHPVSPMNLYGFNASRILRYSDNSGGGLPAAEVRVDTLTNTDALRYYIQDGDTIAALVLDSAQTFPTRTSDKLVPFYTGAACGVTVATWGWFGIDETDRGNGPPDLYEPPINQTYQNLVLKSWDVYGGGGFYGHNTFNVKLENVAATAGWQGLTLWGGYDWVIKDLTGYGADCLLMASTAGLYMEGIQRVAVGNCIYRFSGSLAKCGNLAIEASNLNTGLPAVVNDGFVVAADSTHVTLAPTAPTGGLVINSFNAFSVRIISGTGMGQSRPCTGYNPTTKQVTCAAWGTIPNTTSAYQLVAGHGYSPTESLIRIHPDGTYAYLYDFGDMGTDNEIPLQQCPLIHASRCSGTIGRAAITVRHFVTSGQAGIPAIVLDGGPLVGQTAGYQPADFWIRGLQTDGPEIAVDGPGWNVQSTDNNLPLDVEAIRYTGIQQSAFPLSAMRTATINVYPPPSGRFVAGTVRLIVQNPAAGAVAEYRCTASGTAAWVSTYPYPPWAYVSSGGIEYLAIGANTGNTPSTSPTHWTALGSVGAPTFKALTTVAP